MSRTVGRIELADGSDAMLRTVRLLVCVFAATVFSAPSLAQAADSESEAILAEIDDFLSRIGPFQPPSEEFDADLAALRMIARDFAGDHIAKEKAWRAQQEVEWPDDESFQEINLVSFPTQCDVRYPETSIVYETAPKDALSFTESLVNQEIARIWLNERGYPQDVVSNALSIYNRVGQTIVFSKLDRDELETLFEKFSEQKLISRNEVLEIRHGWNEQIYPEHYQEGYAGLWSKIFLWELADVAAGLILNDYRRNNAPSLPKFAISPPECGAGETPVTMSLEPSDGWGAVIPSFNLKFCKVAGKELEALGECRGWVRFEAGDKLFLSQGGDYFMVGRWPDGKTADVPVRISDDTVRLRPE